jgi:hypothetical protein
MIIHTPASLQAGRRRVTRRLEAAQRVLDRMRSGEALHLTYTQSGPRWELSSNGIVGSEIAALVIQSASITDAGDALFAGNTAQTFKWWRESG